MKTRTPSLGTPPEIKKREDERITQVRRYKLITPLFGGGVEPNQADPITVVRGTEIRGQLRFWWRATRGGQFKGNLKAMRQREEEIWGSAAAKNKPGPSEVIVNVEVLNRGKPFQAVDRNNNPVRNIGDIKSVDSYAAFPLRADTSNPPVLQDVEFALTISNPLKWKQEVEATLWAWETFGGLGARTRRGFGALQLLAIGSKSLKPLNIDQIRIWVLSGLKTHVAEGPWPEGVPHLTKNTKFILTPQNGKTDSIEAWRYLIGKLKKFRQSRHPDSKGRSFGRSKWPEPDQIRRLTHTASSGHEPQHPVAKFPRGQFGLPIIFQFKDKDVEKGDPHQSSLQGANHERFASSLILRPLAYSGGAIGLALKLTSPHSPPHGYALKIDDELQPVTVTDLSASDANAIEPLDGEPDVLQAFLNSLKK